MCGLAGFFTGCTSAQATLSCGTCKAKSTYKSAFRKWDQNAAARSRPARRIEREGLIKGRELMAPSLVPVLAHPRLIQESEESRDRLLALNFYRYMSFTIYLETMIVNEAIRDIALCSGGFLLPQELIDDAYCIYTDEAFHALMSHRLLRDAQRHTEIHPIRYVPSFIRRFEHLTEKFDAEKKRYAWNLFVFVSETLITGYLTQNDDPIVIDSVREGIKDHFEDEMRHHHFFRQFFFIIWPQIPAHWRAEMAALIPSLAEAFLLPDTGMIGNELRAIGLTDRAVRDIIAETYTPDVIALSMEGATQKLQQYTEMMGLNTVGFDYRNIKILEKA